MQSHSTYPTPAELQTVGWQRIVWLSCLGEWQHSMIRLYKDDIVLCI